MLTKMHPGVLLCFVMVFTTVTSETDQINATFNRLLDTSFDYFKTALTQRKEQMIAVGEQVMINQFIAHQRVRSEGNSGLVSVRNYNNGFWNFNSLPYNLLGTFGSFHDHSAYQSIAGVGEITVTMNGVLFTTKHMDYSLVQAHSTSTDWKAVEDVEFPPVPDTVASKANIQEQVDEMIEYFRAFKDRNSTHRPFENYFKPILCYLEGAWLKNYTDIEEPAYSKFYNQRTSTHEDLLHKEMLTSTLGVPYDPSHRIGNLPRTILEFDEQGNPIFAQWNYRILCHPFSYQELPVDYLKVMDDLPYRMTYNVRMEDMPEDRAARFVIDENNAPGLYKDEATLLDTLVSKIPGADNIPAQISIKDYIYRDFKQTSTSTDYLNAGYYNHRYYDTVRDSMRKNNQILGFADDNLYVSLNTRPEIAPMHVFSKDGRQLTDTQLRVTYLMPLEIIYLTPLGNWNPHGIKYFTDKDVRADSSGTENSPYMGTSDMLFAQTPNAFYSTTQPKQRSVADSVINPVFMKDKDGKAQEVASTGIRTFTPPIANNVGSIRLRYPIVPIHTEGDPVYKDLNALKVFFTRRLDELSEAVLGKL